MVKATEANRQDLARDDKQKYTFGKWNIQRTGGCEEYLYYKSNVRFDKSQMSRQMLRF